MNKDSFAVRILVPAQLANLPGTLFKRSGLSNITRDLVAPLKAVSEPALENVTKPYREFLTALGYGCGLRPK
jgi:hypothetical protein